jgi:hypothetical protein
VATAAHRLDAAGRPDFLLWREFMDLCVQQARGRGHGGAGRLWEGLCGAAGAHVRAWTCALGYLPVCGPASGRGLVPPRVPRTFSTRPQGLPVNDTWLVTGAAFGAAARDALDAVALAGGPTARALAELNQLVQVRGRA